MVDAPTIANAPQAPTLSQPSPAVSPFTLPTPPVNQQAAPASPVQAPTAPTTKSAPAVVTPAPAQAKVATVKQNIATQSSAVQTQADKNAQLAADKKTADQADAAANAKLAADQAKTNSVNAATAALNQDQGTQNNANGTNQQYINGNPANGLNPNYVPPTGATSATGTPTSPLEATNKQIQDNLVQIDSAYSDLKTSLSNIANGTFPLNPLQQGLINSILQTNQAAHDAQVLTNKNYAAGVTQAMATSGLQRFSPQTAIGEVTAAVNEGIAKLRDLDAKGNQELLKSESAIQDQDYKQAMDSYDAFSKMMNEKDATLSKLADTMQAHLDKMQEQALQQKQFDQQVKSENFKETMDNANLTIAQKNQALNDFKTSADLSGFYYTDKAGNTKDAQGNPITSSTPGAVKVKTEQAIKDAQDALYKQQDLALRRQAAGAGASNGGLANTVSMLGNGVPNKAQQSQFLAALPGGANGTLATQIKSMAEYKTNPASFSTSAKQAQGGLTRSQLITLAQQYDPSFNEANWAARQALITNFAQGKYSQNVNSLNTAVGHISDILGNFKGLGNTGFTPYNAVTNEVSNIFGSGEPGRAGLNINAATGELARLFTGVGATKDELATLGSINSDSSPTQVKAYIEAATQLLGSKLGALEDTYQAGMGKAKEGGFLSPTSQQALLDLQKQGFDIKIPELADSPILKIQSYRSTLPPASQTALDTFMGNHPEFKNNPQGAVDLLAQNGINL